MKSRTIKRAVLERTRATLSRYLKRPDDFPDGLPDWMLSGLAREAGMEPSEMMEIVDALQEIHRLTHQPPYRRPPFDVR